MSTKKPESIPFSFLLSTPKLQVALHRSIRRGKDDPKMLDAFTAELINGAAKGARFRPGRLRGALGKKAKHIHELAAKYPNHSAPELRKFAEPKIIGDMSERVFANHVSRARTKD